jgi:putative signal transducing protein
VAVEWAELTTVSFGYQSEMILDLLKEAGIPSLTRGPEVGVFGYGFGGPVPKGIRISVPSDNLDEAREILEGHPLP